MHWPCVQLGGESAGLLESGVGGSSAQFTCWSYQAEQSRQAIIRRGLAACFVFTVKCLRDGDRG